MSLNDSSFVAPTSQQPVGSILLLQNTLTNLFIQQGYLPKKIRVTHDFIAVISETLPRLLPQSGSIHFHYCCGVVKLVWDASVEPLWFTL